MEALAIKALDQAVPGGCKWRTRNFGAARGEILRPRRASTMLRRRSGVRWSGLSLLGRYPQTGPRALQTSRAAEDSVHEGRRHELQRARGEDKRAAHRRQVHRRAHRRRVAEGHVAERVVDAEAAVGVDAAEPVHVRVLDRACWWQAESPLLWGGLRRAPAGAASPPPAQAALRAVWERPGPSDAPGRPTGRCPQTGWRPYFHQCAAPSGSPDQPQPTLYSGRYELNCGQPP